MSGGKHTIVLVQTTASRATRTFHDYEGIGVAMDGAPLPPPPVYGLVACGNLSI